MPNPSLSDALKYLQQGEHIAAVPILESLVNDEALAKSTRALAFEALGKVYEQQKNLTFALVCYDKAVNLAPNRLSPWHHLGVSYTAWAVNLMACEHPVEEISVIFAMGKGMLSNVLKRAPQHPVYLQSMIDWCQQYINFIDTFAPENTYTSERANAQEILKTALEKQAVEAPSSPTL